MNYLKLNETGVIDDIKVQCLPVIVRYAKKWENLDGGACDFYDCAFRGGLPCIDIPCMDTEREDKTSVYFKEIKR